MNNSDAYPNDPTESVDSDGDGVGDNSDAGANASNEMVGHRQPVAAVQWISRSC